MCGDKLPEPRTFSWTVPAACTIEGAWGVNSSDQLSAVTEGAWGVNWSDQLSAVFSETCVLTAGSNHPAREVVFILFLKDEEGLCCLCGLHSIWAPGTWSLCSYLWGPSVPSTQLDFEHYWQVGTDVASWPLVRGPIGLPVQCLLPNSFHVSRWPKPSKYRTPFVQNTYSPSSLKAPQGECIATLWHAVIFITNVWFWPNHWDGLPLSHTYSLFQPKW